MVSRTPYWDIIRAAAVSWESSPFHTLSHVGFLLFCIVVATLSGVGGSILHVFDSLEGTIIHEKRLHHSQNVQLYSQRTLGIDVAFGAPKATEGGQEARDLFVLTNGHTIHRIDGVSGDLVWTWTAPEQTYVDDMIPASLGTNHGLGPWSSLNALPSRTPRYMPSDSPNLTLHTPSTSQPSPQRLESP